MKNYERPMVLANEELTEGVYAASGDGTNDGTAAITESPSNQNDGYCISLCGHYSWYKSCCPTKCAIITFNQLVNYLNSQGSIIGSPCGTTLRIRYNNCDGSWGNCDLGNLFVNSAKGLAITNFYTEDDD